jgi:hypothetical protein
VTRLGFRDALDAWTLLWRLHDPTYVIIFLPKNRNIYIEGSDGAAFGLSTKAREQDHMHQPAIAQTLSRGGCWKEGGGGGVGGGAGGWGGFWVRHDP